MTKEARRQPDATRSKIISIFLFVEERILESLSMPSVEFETDSRMLFIEFFKINQTDILSLVKLSKEKLFSLRALTTTYITAAQIFTV